MNKAIGLIFEQFDADDTDLEKVSSIQRGQAEIVEVAEAGGLLDLDVLLDPTIGQDHEVQSHRGLDRLDLGWLDGVDLVCAPDAGVILVEGAQVETLAGNLDIGYPGFLLQNL